MYKVVDKNAELTIENCDLKKQVQELSKVITIHLVPIKPHPLAFH